MTSDRFVIRMRDGDGNRRWLEDYAICGRVVEFSYFSRDREDAQLFPDREHADWIAGHFPGAIVVPA